MLLLRPPESHRHSAEFLLLKGRCLSVAPAFSPTAEECLSRAVKLEPGLVEGWNTLGEQYWKKGDLTAAKTCFTGALQQVRWNDAVEVLEVEMMRVLDCVLRVL